MTISTFQIAKEASKETFRKIVHEDGRQTWYFTDYRGREFFTLIGQRGQFQGTFPINRKLHLPAPRL